VAESMDQMLARVRDGWTVKAKYSVGGEHVIVEGRIHANESTRWYEFRLPDDRVPLCQMTGSLPHSNLVEVVSVTPPPVYTNTDDTKYQIGDIVEDKIGERWITLRSLSDSSPPQADGWCWQPASGVTASRAEGDTYYNLDAPLKLVGRVQPWPPRDSDDDEVFATAQRMMAAEIRGVGTSRRSHHSFAFTKVEDVVYVKADDAARLVESFDLDDAYPPPEWD
jgi:hypothetical protein